MQLDDAALNEKLAAESKAKKEFFKPGKHEVEITSVEYKGAVESDDTWHKFRVVFQGTFGKEISELFLVPTKDVILNTKDGEKSAYPYRKLKDFMSAVGVELSLTTLGATLGKYFGEKSQLVGMNLSIETAFTGPHVKYMGKDEAGNNTYQIVNRREEAIDDAVFADYASAKKAAEDLGIALKGFVDVTKYVGSSTPNVAEKATTKGEW